MEEVACLNISTCLHEEKGRVLSKGRLLSLYLHYCSLFLHETIIYLYLLVSSVELDGDRQWVTRLCLGRRTGCVWYAKAAMSYLMGCLEDPNTHW